MITDELARNRDEWRHRAELLSAIAQACRQIEAWNSPTGTVVADRLVSCASAIDVLSEKAAKVGEAYDLHLQVVSVGGRIQI
ncbi:MAG: hypothetical protein ACTH2U_02800 [Brevibacterium sp.]